MRVRKSFVKGGKKRLELSDLVLAMLVLEAKKGDIQARNIVVLYSLGVVFNQSKLFSRGVVDHKDSFMMGVLGVYEAIRKFDVNKSVNFLLYLGYVDKSFIRNNMPKYTSVSQTLWVERLFVLKIYQRQLALTGDCSSKFLSVETGFSIEKVDKLLNLKTPISLDSEDEGGNGLGNFLVGSVSSEILFQEKKSVPDFIQSVWGQLNEKERFVISHRFGLFGCEVLNLREIGERLSVSKQWIYQIETKAFSKIKEYLSNLGITKTSDIL